MAWSTSLWFFWTRTPILHLSPRNDCVDVFRVRQPLPSYKNSKTGASLLPEDVVVYVLISRATVDRYVSGPFKKWRELQGSMKVLLFIPQPSPLIPEAISLDIEERADHKISDFSIAALQKAYTLFPDKKWFLKFDDDGYLFVPNFLTVLAALDPSDLILGGRVFFEHGSGISGGAGYFMSNQVMAAVAKGSGICYNPGKSKGEDEDLLIQRCAKQQFGPHALQVLNIRGMYAFTVRHTKENHWGGSPEGLIGYPLTFHWIRGAQDTADIHECRFSEY